MTRNRSAKTARVTCPTTPEARATGYTFTTTTTKEK